MHGIPVWYADETTLDKLKAYEVQEIVFAIPSMDVNKRNVYMNIIRMLDIK